MDMLSNILYDSVYHTAPILLCVLGGIFAYKANVLNISLEGIMLAGAFFSMLFSLSLIHILSQSRLRFPYTFCYPYNFSPALF